MELNPEPGSDPGGLPPAPSSTYHFNREILIGECGALAAVNIMAPLISHLTRDATTISTAAVVATLAGGSVGWLAARVYDKVRDRTFTAKAMASDIGYFTPAAILFGFLVYDPAIYLVSHHLLTRGFGGWLAVVLGQVVAFSLFLAALNLYRAVLLKYRGKSL